MPGLSVDRGASGQGATGWSTHRIKRGAIIVLLTVAMGGLANARTAEEAKALVERGLVPIRAVGRDGAFADFSRPDGGFVDGELYIFCLNAAGIVVAHGGNLQLIGHAMADVPGPGGRQLGLEINDFGLTQGYGWLEYRWPNPINKRVELKAVYVLKVDDLTVCGSGYYKGDPP
jgi:cytochrome c